MTTLTVPDRSLLWAVRVLKLIPSLPRKLVSKEDYSGIILTPEKTGYRLKNFGEHATLYLGGGEKGINNTAWALPKLDSLYLARIKIRLIPPVKDTYTIVVIDASQSMAYSALVARPPLADPVDYMIRAENT